MEYWTFWLGMVIFLSFIEVATINLVSIWFVFSALISLMISLFNSNFMIQFTVFVVLGLILLVLTKPILDKYLIKNKKVKTNLDRVIGMIGIVTVDINKNEVGEVKIDGKRWSAISDEEIKTGARVIIEKIDGVKLVVKERKSDVK